MTIKYRKTYLSDGRQVKITEELFNQLIEWEREGREFHFNYLDLLKTQDNEMINENRNYYLHNVSFEGEIEKRNRNLMDMFDKSSNPENIAIGTEQSNLILRFLYLCTQKQRRRFFKYYYLDFQYEKIAEQECCSIATVQRSVKKVEKKLINLINFL